jgi:hypothetical protein
MTGSAYFMEIKIKINHNGSYERHTLSMRPSPEEIYEQNHQRRRVHNRPVTSSRVSDASMSYWTASRLPKGISEH